ncbi:hypothetical protein [Micromonospora mirobrigensis]|uniref:LPXTG-motif cell wall anchor domain-containing protein n=1 Tax=Micromonospora mirobrigensis TaxID=262898 RepID=A0A1C4UC31_9ACTN|nr:hypothetical protein [Micromonospora mirobrigensis]SCE69224.1 hypothetical protein GA0070564_101372 [Micromonospora mirobrigensis]
MNPNRNRTLYLAAATVGLCLSLTNPPAAVAAPEEAGQNAVPALTELVESSQPVDPDQVDPMRPDGATRGPGRGTAEPDEIGQGTSPGEAYGQGTGPGAAYGQGTGPGGAYGQWGGHGRPQLPRTGPSITSLHLLTGTGGAALAFGAALVVVAGYRRRSAW